ncbi:type II toxin-antitoxin system RelE/ParE family toxin [Neorhizobium galegae]|uniref:type II toxin-antitoxin system RelE/ParE family toxin n=1 Tax=Neorhizobium galegae TaxID=399 RepID=UPI00351E98D2
MPKPRGYNLSPRARRDLEEIWRYTFQKWSRAKADDYYHELIDAMLELAGDTRRGKPLDHIRPGYSVSRPVPISSSTNVSEREFRSSASCISG